MPSRFDQTTRRRRSFRKRRPHSLAALVGWLLVVIFSARTAAPARAQDADVFPIGMEDRSESSAGLDPSQLDATIARMVRDAVAEQLGGAVRAAHRQLEEDVRQWSSELRLYQERHRTDLEALEKRLRDDYAQDMGGMELWMRQEHGRAITELQREHHGALALLREELLDHVQLHADRVTEIDGKVKEGMAIWSSVVGATLRATAPEKPNHANQDIGGGRRREIGDGDGASRRESMKDLPKDASWFASKQRLRSGSAT